MTDTQVKSVAALRKSLVNCVLGGTDGFTKNGNISLHFQGFNEETGRASDFIPVETFLENLDVLREEGYEDSDILVRGGIVISLSKSENSKGKGKGKVTRKSSKVEPEGSGVEFDAEMMSKFIAFEKFQRAQKRGK